MNILFKYYSPPVRVVFFAILLVIFSMVFYIDINYLSSGITLLLPYVLLVSLGVLLIGNIPSLVFVILTISFWFISKKTSVPDQMASIYTDLSIKSIFIILQYFLIIYIKKLYRVAESLSLIDDLTGLNNRRGFYTLGQYEIMNLKRNNNNLSILYLDIDNFKSENDSLGHKEGDKILKVLSDVIKRTTRNLDISARIGGDEFCVLLPNTDRHMAKSITKRITDEFSQICSTNSWRTTLSIGVLTTRKIMNLDLLIKKSDDLMYKAKEKGKNKVEYGEL